MVVCLTGEEALQEVLRVCLLCHFRHLFKLRVGATGEESHSTLSSIFIAGRCFIGSLIIYLWRLEKTPWKVFEFLNTVWYPDGNYVIFLLEPLTTWTPAWLCDRQLLMVHVSKTKARKGLLRFRFSVQKYWHTVRQLFLFLRLILKRKAVFGQIYGSHVLVGVSHGGSWFLWVPV